jgi:sarcosine oxidase
MPAIAQGVDETAVGVRVVTDQGAVEADAALLATGAMTDHLSPRPPRMRVYARTASFFEVGGPEAARLAAMPSLLFRVDGPSEPYLLPPIRYPDGRLYLKLGGDPVDVVLETPEAIGDWFRSGGNPEVRDFQETMICRLIPGLAIASVGMTACVTMFTDSGNPVIDRVSDRIALATGGNGQGAKCSDELGRLGAQVVTGGTVPEDTRFH